MGAGVRPCSSSVDLSCRVSLSASEARLLNALQQVFSGATLGFSDAYELIVVGCGHFPHIERTEELGTILSGWLLSS